MEKLVDILKGEAVTITADFKQASILGAGTPQEVSDFRENAFRKFLKRFYPAPYKVAKGKIHDSFGTKPSASIDCILVNPAHPNLIDSQGKFQLLLADAVDFTVEVKPDLSNANELHRALEQGVSVKSLRRAMSPIILKQGKPSHVVKESLRIPYFVFTEKIRKDICAIVADISSWYTNNAIPAEQQLDAITILDFGVLRNIKHPDFFRYGGSNIPLSERSGWFLEPWGDASLVGFLVCAEFSFHSHATIQESVLQRYLKQLTINHLQKILV
jgi:hypothetical protein